VELHMLDSMNKPKPKPILSILLLIPISLHLI
jgi:hypothetical protein